MLLQSFLNDVSLAVNGLTSGTIDGYRAHLSSARSDIALAISNLSAAEEKWRNAESDSTIADEQLNLKRAGPTPESIQTQEASVLEAKAHTESIRRELSKAIMRAPFAGRVTRVDAVVGEIASPNTPLIAVISDQNLEIEVHIPEVDIGRVALHDAVDIGFDAFPGEHFKGMVMAIDPAETIVNGVVNFKVKVGLGTADPRLKSGLTANLAIETATKLNALIIPQFAVIENDQGTFVRRVINGITEEIPVKLGIRSNNGFVEVISGVAEADTVLNVGLRAKSQ